MARDLNNFISDHRASHNRYVSAVDSIIAKYGEDCENELDSVINLSTCKVIKDKTDFFSKTRDFDVTKLPKGGYKKHQKLQHEETKKDDPSLIYVRDTGCDVGDTVDYRFLQDVSTCMSSFLDDGEDEPSDAETLSSSSSESYETLTSETSDNGSDYALENVNLTKVSKNTRRGTLGKENIYDEVDGDIDSPSSGYHIPVVKSIFKNKYHRNSDETFTIEDDDNVGQETQPMNNFILNKRRVHDAKDSHVTDSRPENKPHRSERNNNYKSENYNSSKRGADGAISRRDKHETERERDGTTYRRDNSEAEREREGMTYIQDRYENNNVPMQKSSVKRIQTMYTPFEQSPNGQGRESTKPKYFEKNSRNTSDRGNSRDFHQAIDNRDNLVNSARKNDYLSDINSHQRMSNDQMCNQLRNDLSPSVRKSYVRRNSESIPMDARYRRDTKTNGQLLSPLQCRKVNVVKSSTKTNVRRLCENDPEHEELSKKDSGISTCHDESFAASSHTYEEIPEVLTTKNLKQFNKALMEESVFINVSLNASALKTGEKTDDVEKWLNDVSIEMDKEHDTSIEGQGRVSPLFIEQSMGRHSSKPEVSTSEVRTANKIQLETSRDSDYHVADKINVVSSPGNRSSPRLPKSPHGNRSSPRLPKSSHGNRSSPRLPKSPHGNRSSPRLPKSPKSMQYLEAMARSARQNGNESTPERHRVKLRGQRYQSPLPVYQNLQAVNVGELMRSQSGSDELFTARKLSDLNGKRLINYEGDLICSENDSSALPTPPKSRRLTSTKSTQIDTRYLSGIPAEGNQFVPLNNSRGNTNNNFGQSDRVMGNYSDGYMDTGCYVDRENNSNRLSSSQRSKNDSARRSFNDSRSMASHEMSDSKLSQGSFKSPTRNAFRYTDDEKNMSVNRMENPDNDLVSLNTYPAQSSVRKLPVSSRSKARHNGQSKSCSNTPVNVQRQSRSDQISQNTDFSMNVSNSRYENYPLTTSNDRSEGHLSSQDLQQPTYTMCNFMDSRTMPERSQDYGHSSTSRCNSYRHGKSPQSSRNNEQNTSSSSRPRNVQSQYNNRQLSSDFRPNKRHGDRNIARTPVRELNDDVRDAASHKENEYSEIDGNRDHYDNVMSERRTNEGMYASDYTRHDIEMVGNRDIESYYEEPSGPRHLQMSPGNHMSPRKVQMSPRNVQMSPQNRISPQRSQLSPRRGQLSPRRVQMSPQRQMSESPRMSLEHGQQIGNMYVEPYRRSHVRCRSSERRAVDEDPYSGSQQWNTSEHGATSVDRREPCVHRKTPSMDIVRRREHSGKDNVRRQSHSAEADIIDKFGSPNVPRSNYKQDVLELRSPSTTSRQHTNNSANFQSPTISRMKIHEKFSPSTSLAKMQLHTPKSSAKHPQKVQTVQSNVNKDYPSSHDRRNVVIDSRGAGAHSPRRFINLDQIQGNPLMFKVHMIDAEPAESDEGARDNIDFSNNYICDQFYRQQVRNSERDLVKSNDNVYHKYCDKIRDEQNEAADHSNNDSRREDTLCRGLDDSRNSPQKHSPKMKKSLFSPRTDNRNLSAIPQHRTPTLNTGNTQGFSDFKMPLSPNVISKSKSSMHNKENVMNSTGRSTPSMNSNGRLTLSMNNSGRVMPSMNNSGRLTPTLNNSGRLTPSMNLSNKGTQSAKSSLRNNQSVSNEFNSRLGRKLPSGVNYMQSTPVKPGFEFTLNTTMSTILGSDETEINNEEDEIVLM